MKARLFQFLFSRYVRRTVRNCWLDVQFPQPGVDAILNQMWADYRAEAETIPCQANLGNTLMLHFAALTLSAYRILQRSGIPKEEAIDLVSLVTWQVTSTWTRRGKVILKHFFPNPLNRLHAGMQFIMHTLFSRPGYQFRVERFEDGFRLDVTQCPVAEMMKAKGIPELCVRSWCGVDPGVVAILDGKLTRTGTLAMGMDHCDFVFHLAEE